jgi:UDP-glucose 4-epimerase
LVHEGANVRAFCFYNSNGSLGWLDRSSEDVKKSLDVRLGDIRDARFVEEACRDIDTVFHLAALIAIPFSYQAPQSFVDTNITGTMNVLEGVRRAGCRRLVHTSTSEVYGTPASLPIVETHPLQGQSPYSASKIAADKLCEAYHCSFDVPVLTLRPFNTYGPRQSLRAVLPTILAQLLSGKRTLRIGNLAPRRDLTFVGDTVEGFLLAGERSGVEGETIQLGTGRAVSVKELLDLAQSALGVSVSVVEEPKRVRPERSEVMVLLSNPAKASSLLGWAPRVGLEQGLRDTAKWIEESGLQFDSDRYFV